MTGRNLARGALATAALGHASHLALLAGWSGAGRGRSTLFFGVFAAIAIASGVPRSRSRWFLALSVIAIAAFAWLSHVPSWLHPTGIAWVDATLVLLLPSVPLVARFRQQRTSLAFAALGGIFALAVDETLLLPRLGFSATLIAWALVWALAERAERALQDEDRGGLRIPETVGLVGVCTGLGFGVAVARPFLTQHLPPDRAGAHVIALAILASAALGFLTAAAFTRSARSPWTACAGTAILLLGSAVSWRALTIVSWERWPAWLTVLHEAGSSTPKTWMSVWLFLALPSLGFGFALRALASGDARACAFAWAGLWMGTLAAERLALPALGETGAWAAAARARLFHPPLIEVQSFAVISDGVATRHPDRSVEELEVRNWQAIPWTRPKSWARLEACETPTSPGLVSIGFPRHEAGLAAFGHNPCEDLFGRAFAARDVVFPSHPAPASSLILAETATGLERIARAAGAGGSVRAWCDPRGLSVEGLETTLATWRAALPAGRVRVLFDGYAGPLIGIEPAGAPPASADVEALTYASLAVGELRVDGAGVSTTDRPLLLWQWVPHPASFELADAAVVRALARALALPPRGFAGLILEGLARHAEQQEVREIAASTYDRVRVPEGEIAAYKEALGAGGDFEPGLRHLESVAELLYHKRDFDVLVSLMRQATAAYPGRPAFHRHLGRALLELLDVDGAVVELEQGYALDPGSIEVRTELAKAYSDVRRFGDAARLLESVWEEKPALEIAKALGLTCVELQDYRRARQYLEFVRARSPGEVEVERALDRMSREGH